MGSRFQGASESLLLAPASYATSALASGNFVDIRAFDGEIMVIQHVRSAAGAVTGYLVGTSSSTGVGASSVNFNEGDFTSAATSANIQMRTVDTNSIPRYVGYAGVLTGTAFIAVSLVGKKRDSGY